MFSTFSSLVPDDLFNILMISPTEKQMEKFA